MGNRGRQRSSKHEELVGTRLGRLTVRRVEHGRTDGGVACWWLICDCDCGVSGHRIAYHNRKTVQSCGCYRRDSKAKRRGEPGINVGDRSERLVVLALKQGHTKSGKSVRLLHCRCDCGNTAVVREDDFLYATVKSCGCLRRELAATRTRTHGMYRAPLYHLWQTVKDRVNNPRNPNYGGRGVTMYGPWSADFLLFEEYIATQLGDKPTERHSLDRIDVERGYEPGNLRWASPAEQARNRRCNVLITVEDETLCVSDWAQRLGVTPQTVFQRLKLGWSERDAVTTPARRRRRA
jgi:hypothetical protein